jgi:DNA-binding response OmpR family regulator
VDWEELRVPDTESMSQPADRPDLNPAQPGGLRVLVVDDEQALADLVGSYLTRDGFEVFSPRELLARVHAMLRRPRASTNGREPAQEAPPRVFGALSVDVAGREVHRDGEPVALTRTEFDLLEALSARPAMVFSRRQLVDAVWDESWVGDEHLVDVHVGHLRRKLGDDPSSPRYVRTVRGVGYRMGDGT